MWRVGIRKEDRRSLCAHANSKVPSRIEIGKPAKGAHPPKNSNSEKASTLWTARAVQNRTERNAETSVPQMCFTVQKSKKTNPTAKRRPNPVSLTEQNLVHRETAPSPTTRTKAVGHIQQPIRDFIHWPRITNLLPRTIRLRKQRNVKPSKRTLAQIRIRDLETNLYSRWISIQNTTIRFLQFLGIARDGGAAFRSADRTHAVSDAAGGSAGVVAGAEGEVSVWRGNFYDPPALVAPVDGERDVHPVVGVCYGGVWVLGGEFVAIAAAVGFAVLIEAVDLCQLETPKFIGEGWLLTVKAVLMSSNAGTRGGG